MIDAFLFHSMQMSDIQKVDKLNEAMLLLAAVR